MLAPTAYAITWMRQSSASGTHRRTRAELIAASHDVEQIRAYLGADSLGYLSLEGLVESVRNVEGKGRDKDAYCHACFSGQYPIAIPQGRPRHLRLVNG